jgi:hypothetical protein
MFTKPKFKISKFYGVDILIVDIMTVDEYQTPSMSVENRENTIFSNLLYPRRGR